MAMMEMGGDDVPLRLREGPARLVLRAIGGPRQIAGKLRRVASTAALYASPREIPSRLELVETVVEALEQLQVVDRVEVHHLHEVPDDRVPG